MSGKNIKTVNPNKVGAPTKYKKEYAQIAVDMLKKGKYHSHIMSELGISKQTFYRWKKENQEFKEACEIGKQAAQAMWEDIIEAIALGKLPQANTTAALALMNNRFDGWARDKKEDNSVVNNINVESMQILQNVQRLDDTSLDARIRLLTEKYNEKDDNVDGNDS